MASASVKSTIARLTGYSYCDLEDLKKVKISKSEQKNVLEYLEKKKSNEIDLPEVIKEGKPLKRGKNIIMLGLILLNFVLLVAGEQVEIKNVKPDFKVTKFTYTRENENSTDVMSPDAPKLELIPVEFLCEFCQVVIIKLKERQLNEPDFEQKIRDDCLGNDKSNSTDSSLCDVINRVNLERLRNDNARKICEEQNLCKTAGSPAISPFQGVGTAEEGKEPIDKPVAFTMHVEDIAPPY